MKKTKDIISVTFTQIPIDEIIIDYVKNMTPRERARDIFKKMYLTEDINGNAAMFVHVAKKCSLIVVEHCLLTAKYMPETLNYWNKVKQEIENL